MQRQWLNLIFGILLAALVGLPVGCGPGTTTVDPSETPSAEEYEADFAAEAESEPGAPKESDTSTP